MLPFLSCLKPIEKAGDFSSAFVDQPNDNPIYLLGIVIYSSRFINIRY